MDNWCFIGAEITNTRTGIIATEILINTVLNINTNK